MKNKLIASIVLAAVPLMAAAPSAEASGPPATCASERWYPGPEYCDNHPWIFTIEEDCAQAKVYNYSWWKHDKICQSFAKKSKKYKVRKGDTLWRISTKYYGTGKYWKKIAKVNNVKGTMIRTGQVLVIPAR